MRYQTSSHVVGWLPVNDVTRRLCINAGASPSGTGIGAHGILIEIPLLPSINMVVCRISSPFACIPKHADQVPYGNGFPSQGEI